jgi:hypothetical protein
MSKSLPELLSKGIVAGFKHRAIYLELPIGERRSQAMAMMRCRGQASIAKGIERLTLWASEHFWAKASMVRLIFCTPLQSRQLSVLRRLTFSGDLRPPRRRPRLSLTLLPAPNP